MHASKFASDEPGRGYDRRGKASHSVSTSVEPKEQEAIRFAKTIADHIARAVTDNAIGRLYLVASDHSLGLLRKHIGSLHNVETIEVNKNLEHMDARDIRTHLPERL